MKSDLPEGGLPSNLELTAENRLLFDRTLNGLKLHSCNQKDPGSIPGEAFYIFFQRIFKKTFFSSTLKRFCEKPRKSAKLKPLKIIQKSLKEMLGDGETHGLWRPLDLILLSKIEWIFTLNATNLHQNAVRNCSKLLQI